MPGPGRNQPCPCGSGRKVKRCCGEHRGPSEDQLASAHLATLAHDAVHDLAHLSDQALEILWEGLFDLPTTDLSLHVKLPALITPELQRLQSAVADDDPDRGWEELRTVTEQIDTPHNAPTSPTRSSDSAINIASPAPKPPTRSTTSTPAPSTSSPPASPTPSPSQPAPTAPPAASKSPPNPDCLSGGSG